MRSLFLRIFIWFWLAITFIGAVGVVIALTSNPRAEAIARHEKQLRAAGKELIGAYERGGSQDLSELAGRIERRSGFVIFLFSDSRGPLSGRPVPPRSRRLASVAFATGEPQRAPGRNGFWYAVPIGDDYVVLAELPRPSRLSLILSPRSIFLRLSVTFIVAGLVCYLLARSLTAPIRQLQAASRRFADGELGTRVGPLLKGREDEIAALGADFDRMAERIESLITSQQRLLRDISHELRSPLARLNVALELARQRSGYEATGALDRIEREAERLNTLIGQLLMLTLLESGGAENVEKEQVDLTALLQEIVDDANFENADSGRPARITATEEVSVKGSAEMLRSAVENVIRNAVRHADEGSDVEVSLQKLQRENGAACAVITVRDHGPGVPEAALVHLFEPFYRVAEARDRQTGGTGIGLAITQRAVRAHGGSVSASNAPNGGLVVSISLPLQPGA